MHPRDHTPTALKGIDIGTEIFGVLPPQRRWGTHADYVAVPEKFLAPKPPTLYAPSHPLPPPSSSARDPRNLRCPPPPRRKHDEASAIPFAALTAFRAVATEVGLSAAVPPHRPRRTKRVLILGAGSAVGLTAAQMAQTTGAEVWGVASPDGCERSRPWVQGNMQWVPFGQLGHMSSLGDAGAAPAAMKEVCPSPIWNNAPRPRGAC